MLCFDSFCDENTSWKVGLFIQETYTIAYKTECVCTKDFTLGDINLISYSLSICIWYYCGVNLFLLKTLIEWQHDRITTKYEQKHCVQFSPFS